MPQLDVNDIQGNVIAGYGTTYACYVFLRFEQVDERVVRFLRTFEPTMAGRRVLRTEPWSTTRNIAFSAAGLIKLGLPDDAIQALPLAFRVGMRQRAHPIGDRDRSAPGTWDAWTREPIDALVTITGWSPICCEVEADRFARSIPWFPRTIRRVHVQAAAALRRVDAPPADPRGQQAAVAPFRFPPPHDADRPEAWHYEPFGFRDGLSNPVIEGSERVMRAGDGTLRHGRWQPMKAGEFILGHEDDNRSIDLPGPLRRFFRNGSYMVWRKLEQDVAAFRAAFESKPAEAARKVGRWPDGTPLALSPHECPAAPGTNDFTYGGDPLGTLCPVSAHIRRANPRDALDFADEVVGRHRMIRRGMPYDDATGTGLIFVCFNADIERQFEFVQRRWIIDDPARVTRSSPDLIAASATEPGLASYVRTRAGEYFFQPGLLGLEALTWEARRRLA